jgi:hypothetical protein
MVVHVPCLCYSRKGMELFYEKGEDKNGVLSYGIYRRNRRNCGKKIPFYSRGISGFK